MVGGFWGRILRVDLGAGRISSESYPGEWYRTYFGGWGLVAYVLLREVQGVTDPLSPENKFVFAPGLMTGIRMGGTGRNAIGAKSPLTNGFGESDVGGFWGAELKRAGWDGIVIEGRSREPVYLWIDDDLVELRDARHLWGTTTDEAQRQIRQDLGDENVRISQIGIAGERLARHACLLNDLNHAAGRCGLGAVLGSKLLRGVAVRGSKDVPTLSGTVSAQVAEWTRAALRDDPRVSTLHTFGQAGDMIPQDEVGGLPTRNFRDGHFEGVNSISGERMAQEFRVAGGTCYMCGIACKSIVHVQGPYDVDPIYGGPEYESIAALGSCCGIDSLEAICKANELCNAYGLDTIGVGATIAWAMEAHERGILKKELADGLDLCFGNSEVLVTLVDRIAKREGIGDWLAEGAYRCARELGKGSMEFVVHSHRQEAPMHDPRLKHALGIGYAVSPTGADHMHNIHDSLYASDGGIDDLRGVGIHQPLAENDLSPAKMRMAKHVIPWNVFWNCIGLCQTFRFPRASLRDLVNSVTGWQTTVLELEEVGERALDMAREFNRRCGWSTSDEDLPHRFYEPLGNGPQRGMTIQRREFRQALRCFSDMMGWDAETGAPLDWKLHALGLDWVVEQRNGECKTTRRRR